MLRRRLSKVAVFLLCLVPVAWVVIAALTGALSANPIKDITEDTGTWTLRFLLITLCVTPFRKLTGWNEAIKYRRMLGLFAFFYGFLHFLTYAWLDQFFSIADIVQDVYKRPFITAGFSGFLVMIPLMITSTRKWIARLGGKQWQRLHRLTYVGAIAGVVHYLWLVKADTQRPLAYGFLLSILLGYRVVGSLRSHRPVTVRSGGVARRIVGWSIGNYSNDRVLNSDDQIRGFARSVFAKMNLLSREIYGFVRPHCLNTGKAFLTACDRSSQGDFETTVDPNCQVEVSPKAALE